MRYLSEDQSSSLISHELAYDAVKAAFIAAATGEGTVFPAVSAHAADSTHTFSVKSGSAPGYAGVKLGSYWPSNDALGIPRHGTTIILLDQATGHLAAAVEAAQVNAYRTAAADAVAADALARRDARTLTVFGNGHQALYECLALVRIRPIERINVVARAPARGQGFVAELAARGFNAHLADARSACEAADIITCATASRGPLFNADWVRPGTHVVSMGSDTRGKQELPPDLFSRARLFCDLPAQAVEIGEFQHICDLVADGSLAVTAIGAVLTGAAEGRSSREEISVFDSSGIALQDLAVATALLRLTS